MKAQVISFNQLSAIDKEKLIEVFLSKSKYPVRKQNWHWDDVCFFVSRNKEIWAIKECLKNSIIGYVYISLNENCFEILIKEDFINLGYGVWATLYTVNEYLKTNLVCDEIITRIYYENYISLSQALRFGWKIKEQTGEWKLLSLSRESFIRTYLRFK